MGFLLTLILVQELVKASGAQTPRDIERLERGQDRTIERLEMMEKEAALGRDAAVKTVTDKIDSVNTSIKPSLDALVVEIRDLKIEVRDAAIAVKSAQSGTGWLMERGESLGVILIAFALVLKHLGVIPEVKRNRQNDGAKREQ